MGGREFPAGRTRRRTTQPRAKTQLTIDLYSVLGRLPPCRHRHVASNRFRPGARYPVLNWWRPTAALDEGYRGLKGGTTLADLLQDQRASATSRTCRAWTSSRSLRGLMPTARRLAITLASNPARLAAPLARRGRGSTRHWTRASAACPAVRRWAQLLAECRDCRGPLTVERILAWADAHHAASGRWPTAWSSGRVRGAPREAWPIIDDSLRDGRRGLPGGTTLAQLLAEHRQAPNIYTEPLLTVEQIFAWAEAHRAATGRWPSSQSGPVLHAKGENWGSIETALRDGYRSLPGGQALGRLIRGHAGPDVYRRPPRVDRRADPRLGRRPPRDHRRVADRGSGAVSLGPGRNLESNQRYPYSMAAVACQADRRWPDCWPSTAASAIRMTSLLNGASRSSRGPTPTALRPAAGRRASQDRWPRVRRRPGRGLLGPVERLPRPARRLVFGSLPVQAPAGATASAVVKDDSHLGPRPTGGYRPLAGCPRRPGGRRDPRRSWAAVDSP